METQRRLFRIEYHRSIVHGVALCALSPVLVCVAGIMGANSLIMLGVAVLLVMIALGVYLCVRDGMIMGSLTHLLRRADIGMKKPCKGK